MAINLKSHSTLLKVTSLTSVSTVIKIAGSFIISKIISIQTGPAGLALLGQLINFTSIVTVITTGGLSQGITKYIAETDDKKQHQSLLNVAFSLCISLVIANSVIIFFFFRQNKFFSILFK